MKVARLHDDHLCVECRSAVAKGVKICPVCKSYQDWRRYITIGTANLALIVALISVATPLLNLGIYYAKPAGSEISVLMTNATSTSFEFLAKNDGRSQGVIRFTSFTFGARDREQSFPIDQTVNKGVLLAAGGTMSMTIAAPASEFEQFCAKIPVPPPAALPTPGNILPPPLRSLTLKISASTFHCGVHFSARQVSMTQPIVA